MSLRTDTIRKLEKYNCEVLMKMIIKRLRRESKEVLAQKLADMTFPRQVSNLLLEAHSLSRKINE